MKARTIVIHQGEFYLTSRIGSTLNVLWQQPLNVVHVTCSLTAIYICEDRKNSKNLPVSAASATVAKQRLSYPLKMKVSPRKKVYFYFTSKDARQLCYEHALRGQGLRTPQDQYVAKEYPKGIHDITVMQARHKFTGERMTVKMYELVDNYPIVVPEIALSV